MSISTRSGTDELQADKLPISSIASAREFFAGQKSVDGDAFSSEIKKSADKSGCRFLFEFPAMLIDREADKAAVILCPDEKNFSLVFLVYQQKQARIRIVESGDAPMSLVDFSWSFARVLSFLSTADEASLQ